MRIDHDKVSGALYVKLREGDYDHTETFSERADVYLDVDAEGNVLGLEALSFEDLAQAIEERGGKLEVPDRLAVGEVVPPEFPFTMEELKGALSSLESRQQQTLRIYYLEGLPLEQVADRLGVSVSTANRLRLAGLQNLREALVEREPGTVDDASLEALLSTL